MIHMPLQTNEERNRIIYGLWESGKTVDEIALSTGIPRGTVAYYVRKFNRLARQGISPVFAHKARKRGPDDLALSALEKILCFQPVLEMIKVGNFDRSYYYLSTMKLLLELRNHLTLDEEEMRAYRDALQSIARALQSPGAQPTTPRHKTADEILRAGKPPAGHPVQ